MFGVTSGTGCRIGFLPLLVTAVLLATAAGSTTKADESITVSIDQAKIFKAPERTATLVVGNPLIADAAVQPGGLVVITAKSYGLTNLIALDRAGVKLSEHSIQVVGPSDPIVVVYRGIERESYSCTPMCQRRITVGDTPAYFNATLGQAGEIGKQTQSQSPK